MVEVLGHYSNHARAANAVIELLDRATRGEIRLPHLETPAVNRTLERSGRLSKVRIDELVERHQAGESARALADEHGIHRETTRALLKKRGLESRPPRFVTLSTQDAERVSDAYQRLGSVRATARELKYSERIVARTLDARGAPVRRVRSTVRDESVI